MRRALPGLLLLGTLVACGQAADGVTSDAGASPDTNPPAIDASADSGALDAATPDAHDSGGADSDGGDSGPCGSQSYQVVPCCGGPAPLPDAAPCTPAPPFCAPLPAGCSAGHDCPGVCQGGSGLVDGATRTVHCLCA